MKTYQPFISLSKNDRGIWDLDTSKGCASGMSEDNRGCYSDCYAARAAKIYGYDFSTTVLRQFRNKAHQRSIIARINNIPASFIRLGCSGDPSENWHHTFSILNKITTITKEIVIITKHWTVIPDEYLPVLKSLDICINTSVSALDEPNQLSKRMEQYERLKPYCKSILRIVSCDFNKENETGAALSKIQDELFLNHPFIDTVFRPTLKNKLVTDGVINIKKTNFLGHKIIASKFNRKTYLGKCDTCTEKCGVFNDTNHNKQTQLFSL